VGGGFIKQKEAGLKPCLIECDERKTNAGILRLRLAQGAPNFAQDDGSNYWMTMVEGG